MFYLGIIGSDSSHAIQFASLANLDTGVNGRAISGVQVSHIYGTNSVKTREIAQKCFIPKIVDNPLDMIGEVDGVICVLRHGSKHLQAVLPFLNAGVPVFVDKPLASSVKDAEVLIEAALKANVGFTSFSVLRFSPSTSEFIEKIFDKVGKFCSGILTGPANRQSEYDGLFFYGIHTVELMQTVFGTGCCKVTALEHGKNIGVFCKFTNDLIVLLNFLGDATYVFHVAVFGTSGWQASEIDAASGYYEGMKIFTECLQTGRWPLTPEQLLEPIKILEAIELSLQKGREIVVA